MGWLIEEKKNQIYMKISFKNWKKPANKVVSNIANILILLNIGLIPSILYLPISAEIKIWIIGIYNILASLINLYIKLSKTNNIDDVQSITKV